MTKEIIILCGGQGTRLREAVSDRPKVLAEVGDQKPFLDILIEKAKSHGFKPIILAVGYMREHLKNRYMNDRDILFSEEDVPLGTGGAIKKALPLIQGEHFLVMNGDSWCDIDLDAFHQFHVDKGASLSMVLASANNRNDAGNVHIDDQGKIVSFNEKKGSSQLINAGIYGMTKGIVTHFPDSDSFSLEQVVFPKLAGQNCYAFLTNSEVMDIGTPERYYKYAKQFKKSMKLHLGCGEKYLEGYWNIDYPQSEHTVVKVKADEYADIRTLSYEENSIEEVRNHHMFEHFPRAKALKLLATWRHWLKPDGVLMIETPDFGRCAAAYVRAWSKKRRFELGRHMLGSQEANWAYHYDFWDKRKFEYVLREFGFKNIRVKRYQNALAQKYSSFPGSAFILNIAGNLLPSSVYEKYGGHKLPNIVVTAEKDASQKINDRAVARKILSQYLVGREGEDMLSVWVNDFES